MYHHKGTRDLIQRHPNLLRICQISRKAKEAAEEEAEELTKQLLKLGKIVPPSPGGEDDKRRECFEGLEKEGNNETE